jgi:phosphoribosylformylglycinamidine synthase
MTQGIVLSCHDISEGGLALALSEMAFSGDVGFDIDLENVIYTGTKRRFDFLLFSESNTRFLVEIKKENSSKLKKIFNNLPLAKIGMTTREKRVKMRHGKKPLIDLPLDIIRVKWKRKIV